MFKSTFLKIPVIVWFFGAVLLLGVLYGTRDGVVIPETISVARMDIIETVSVTGKVVDEASVELAFLKNGQVETVYAKEGETVLLGKPIAELENGNELAQLRRAEAELAAQEATLSKLKAGSSPSDLKLLEIKEASAKTSLEDAGDILDNNILSSYTKADDAIRNYADILFTNPRTENPQLTVFTSDSNERNAETGRRALELILTDWNITLASYSIDNKIFDYPTYTRNKLIDVRNFLVIMADIVNNLVPSSNLPSTLIDTYKSSISTARLSIDTALTNLSSAQEKYRLAEANLKIATQERVIASSSARPEDIKAQEARVLQARADVLVAESQFDKTILVAPLFGIIGNLNIRVGQTVTANNIVGTIVSQEGFDIEAYIPEVDIARVQVGDVGTVLFDAYETNKSFPVVVKSINASDTIRDGVPTYKVLLSFNTDISGIKTGMTANVDIETEREVNALSIPYRALRSDENGVYVTVLKGTIQERVDVSTGIRDIRGNTSVTNLEEGTLVVIPE